MGKKINLSDNKKAAIKANYDTYKPRNKQEQQYYNKIKAGKARAANSIKDNSGKYITKILKKEVIKTLAAQKGVNTRTEKNKARKIEEVIKEAQISDKELKRYYEYNRDEFQKMIENKGLQGAHRNYNQLSGDLDEYKGKIFLQQGDEIKKVNKSQANFALDEFKQFLSTEFTAVDFSISPELKFDGRMIINLPDPEQMKERILELSEWDEWDEFINEVEPGGLAALLQKYFEEEFDGEIVVYVSPPKKG